MNEEQRAILPDGRTLGYAEYGDPAGAPLFFFHGWPSSRYQGQLLHEPGRELGFRVITPDRPGIGLSAPFPGRGFRHWPADVAALADTLGIDRFHVFGFSGGGPYTLATAAALPDRVKAAVVMGGAPPILEEDRARMHFAYRILGGLPGLRRAATPMLLKGSRWMVSRGPDSVPMSWLLKSIPLRDREAIHGAGGWDGVMHSYLEAARSAPSSVLEDGELYLSGWDFDPAEVRVPVAFWHGDADKNLPLAAAQRLAARIPGAETHWIPGEGHYSLPMEYRDEAIRWLAGHA